MGDAKSIKERGILEQVIKSELDFITYVDVHLYIPEHFM